MKDKKIISYIITISLIVSSVVLVIASNHGFLTHLVYTDNTTNSTSAGQPVLFSMNWTSNVSLNNTGGYIFSYDNGTGTFVNDSFIRWGEVPHNSSDWRDSLSVLYHLNNDTVPNVTDYGLYNNNSGVLTSGAIYVTNTSCKFGQCVYFDGTNDRIASSFPTGLVGDRNWTVSFWMNYELQPSRYWIMDFGTFAVNTNVHFIVNTANTTQFGILSGGQNSFSITNQHRKWAHYVTTYDVPTRLITSYVNGNQVDQDTVVTAPNIGNAKGLDIAQAQLGESAFEGYLDEIAIWNRSLTTTEIRQLYNLSSQWDRDINQSWANITKTTNSTPGSNIRWRVYANDSANNINNTDIFSMLTQKIIYQQNTTNSTNLGEPVLFSSNWTSDTWLNRTGGYIFSYDNGTGSFVNDSFIYWGEIPHNSSDWRLNLTALWHLNNDSVLVNSVKDYGANSSETGKLFNGSLFVNNASCRFGSCVNFDGSNDNIEFPYSPRLDLTNDYVTISAWVYPRGSGYRQIVEMATDTGAGRKLGLYIDPNNAVGVNVRTSLGNGDVSYIGNSAPNNAWTHVVLLYNTTRVIAYANGTHLGDFLQTGNIVSTPNQPLHIGIFKTVSPFNGYIDEVAIWDRALTPTEIRQLYNLSSKWLNGNNVNQSWVNITKTTNSSATSQSPIRWRLYANDSANNINNTDIFQFPIAFTSLISHTISYNNFESREENSIRQASQTITLSNFEQSIKVSVRNLGQTINLNLFIQRIESGLRQVVQTITLSNVEQKIRNVIKSITQTLSLNASFQRILGAVRNISLTFTLSNFELRIENAIRQITQTLSLSNVEQRIENAILQIIQTISFNSFIQRIENSIREISQTITLSNVEQRVKGFVREITQAFNISSFVLRIENAIRQITQTITLSNFELRIENTLRELTQTLNLNSFILRIENSIRSVTQTITLNYNFFTEAVSGAVTSFTRTVVQTFTLSNLEERIRGVVRDMTQSFTLVNIEQRLVGLFRTLLQTILIAFGFEQEPPIIVAPGGGAGGGAEGIIPPPFIPEFVPTPSILDDYIRYSPISGKSILFHELILLNAVRIPIWIIAIIISINIMIIAIISTLLDREVSTWKRFRREIKTRVQI